MEAAHPAARLHDHPRHGWPVLLPEAGDRRRRDRRGFGALDQPDQRPWRLPRAHWQVCGAGAASRTSPSGSVGWPVADGSDEVVTAVASTARRASQVKLAAGGGISPMYDRSDKACSTSSPELRAAVQAGWPTRHLRRGARPHAGGDPASVEAGASAIDNAHLIDEATMKLDRRARRVPVAAGLVFGGAFATPVAGALPLPPPPLTRRSRRSARVPRMVSAGLDHMMQLAKKCKVRSRSAPTCSAVRGFDWEQLREFGARSAVDSARSRSCSRRPSDQTASCWRCLGCAIPYAGGKFGVLAGAWSGPAGRRRQSASRTSALEAPEDAARDRQRAAGGALDARLSAARVARICQRRAPSSGRGEAPPLQRHARRIRSSCAPPCRRSRAAPVFERVPRQYLEALGRSGRRSSRTESSSAAAARRSAVARRGVSAAFHSVPKVRKCPTVVP